MPLCSTNALLRQAEKRNLAIGAFNVGNMEILWGAVRAAEETGSPIILQLAEKRLAHTPLELMAPMMVNAARTARVDIAVQLDHGFSAQVIRQAMDYGFTGVMFDGSSLPLAQNIEATRRVVSAAAGRGVTVEAEIGVIGGSEGNAPVTASCADPDEAVRLGRESGCDALAVAIGNAHGHYRGTPKLNFDVLESIHRRLDRPLVLHGGTGIPPADFRRAIDRGIRKINIATAMFDAFVGGAERYLKDAAQPDYFALSEAAADAVRRTAVRYIRIFNNRGE